RHCHGDVYTFFERAQHATRSRAVDVQCGSDAGIRSRNYDGLAIDQEADVTYEGFIKDPVNRGVIVLASLRQAFQDCSLSWRKGRQVVCSIVIARRRPAAST